MSDKKTAFITGAAMGMGALMARTLSDRGWEVYAGVVPGADTSELLPYNNITAIEQDVTNDDSVKKSGEELAKLLDGRGLDLLINNAGIANIGIGVIEGADIERGHFMFEVNTWGPMRVCQSFLPFIRQNKGRVINFASGAVKANPPASGVYNMSKHAVIGMTLTMRHELAALGVQVTSIEPGAVKTHMTKDPFESTQNIWKEVPEKMKDVYFPHLGATTTEVLPQSIIDTGNDPVDVVNQVLGLLAIKKWKPSYMVGKDVKLMPLLHKILPALTFESIIQGAFKIPKK